MSFALLPGVALRGPLHPDADTAREWLRQELLRREYRPNLVQRMQEWFQELLDKAQGGTGNFGGLSDAVLLGLTVVVALLLVFVLSRLRRNAGADRTPEPVFGDVRRSAAEHRRLARAAYDTGVWDDAVVEGMRALAAGLVERQLVDDVPAATAHEVTTLAAPRFPSYADRLETAAAVFDETRYGDHRATRERAGDDARPRVGDHRCQPGQRKRRPWPRWRRSPDERDDHRASPAQPHPAAPRPGGPCRDRGPGRGQPRQRPLRWRPRPPQPRSDGSTGGRQGAGPTTASTSGSCATSGRSATHPSTRTPRWW